jgi:hypothetical protein
MAVLVASPIHGDDLISPFVFLDQYNGSLIDYLARMSFVYDGHFNYLGEIIGAIWLQLWVFVLEKSNSILVFQSYYYFTKLIVTFLFLFVLWKFFLRNTPQRTRLHQLSILSISFGLITIYHVNWSSDPVGNYPLIGYMATILGALFIYMLTSTKTVCGWKRQLMLSATFSIAVLYYEMNLALIPVIVFYAIRANKKLSKIQSTLLFVGPITCVFLLVSFSQNMYPGTDVHINWKFVITLVLQVLSILPIATYPLAVFFNPLTLITMSLSMILGWISLRNFVVYKGHKSNPFSMVFKEVSNLFQEEMFKLLGIYFVSACIIYSFTSKYQAEIKYPGQVYMSYTVGQFLLILIVARLLIKKRDFTVMPIVVLSICVLLNGSQNALLIDTLKDRTKRTTQLLHSWSEEEAQRCSALKEWNEYNWDRNYLETMAESFSKSFEDIPGELYCKMSITHVQDLR